METLISLLPSYNIPTILLFSDGLPCHGAKLEIKPIEYILEKIKRQIWVEGLYISKKDLTKLIRYKNPDGSYKNDFDEKQFIKWITALENNTALCDTENNSMGNGVFVPPGKMLPQGTFIPASGIIKFDPTIEELETKVNCSALLNLNSPEKEIIGIIDPEKKGGILNFINHAPDKEELVNFIFKNSSIKENVATANIISKIKFYNGYAIMGLETRENIEGGEHGAQLLWSYARSCEYIDFDKPILLFDNRAIHNGEILDVNNYTLREITIYIDAGELMLQTVASITRWELMERSPESGLIISTEDPYSMEKSKPIQSLIPHKFIQNYLTQNPQADRIIIQAHILKAIKDII